MNWKQTWIWMGITAFAFGLFWLIWSMVVGEIPAVRELTMRFVDLETGEPGTVWVLPLSVSYLWSMAVAPLFVLAFAWIFSSVREMKARENVDPYSILLTGLVCGPLFGLGVGLDGELSAGLNTGLIIGLSTGLAPGLLLGLRAGLYSIIGYGLSFGFFCGLVWTMPLGALFGAFVALLPALILIVLTVLISGTKEIIQSLSGRVTADI